MKAVLITLAALMLVPLTACRESPALVELHGIDLTLAGKWSETEESEYGELFWAEITDDSVEVWLRIDNVDHLCWQGTYTKPVDKPDRYLWCSANTYVTCQAATYDRDSVKLFEYYDGHIEFSLGIDYITLERVET